MSENVEMSKAFCPKCGTKLKITAFAEMVEGCVVPIVSIKAIRITTVYFVCFNGSCCYKQAVEFDDAIFELKKNET